MTKIAKVSNPIILTRDRKIRVWFKTMPVSKQKKRKSNTFQNLRIAGVKGQW